jgi:hypothetical protein
MAVRVNSIAATAMLSALASAGWTFPPYSYTTFRTVPSGAHKPGYKGAFVVEHDDVGPAGAIPSTTHVLVVCSDNIIWVLNLVL